VVAFRNMPPWVSMRALCLLSLMLRSRVAECSCYRAVSHAGATCASADLHPVSSADDCFLAVSSANGKTAVYTDFSVKAVRYPMEPSGCYSGRKMEIQSVEAQRGTFYYSSRFNTASTSYGAHPTSVAVVHCRISPQCRVGGDGMSCGDRFDADIPLPSTCICKKTRQDASCLEWSDYSVSSPSSPSSPSLLYQFTIILPAMLGLCCLGGSCFIFKKYVRQQPPVAEPDGAATSPPDVMRAIVMSKSAPGSVTPPAAQSLELVQKALELKQLQDDGKTIIDIYDLVPTEVGTPSDNEDDSMTAYASFGSSNAKLRELCLDNNWLDTAELADNDDMELPMIQTCSTASDMAPGRHLSQLLGVVNKPVEAILPEPSLPASSRDDLDDHSHPPLDDDEILCDDDLPWTISDTVSEVDSI